MKPRLRTYICLVGIVLFLAAGNSFAVDEAPLTAQERLEAQQVAQRFVKRMQETRDVALLVDEMFLPNFISHFTSGDESMSPSLYSRLTKAERQRLFIAQTNGSYLISLDVIYQTKSSYSEEPSGKSAFESILPAAMAKRLRDTAWRDGELHFSSYPDFQLRLTKLEKVLSQTRLYLLKRGLEQTPEFQRKLDDTIQDTGINYRVRAYIGGDQIQDSESLVGFPAPQKFFRVETPLLMGVILIKDGNQMKIVRLTSADDD